MISSMISMVPPKHHHLVGYRLKSSPGLLAVVVNALKWSRRELEGMTWITYPRGHGQKLGQRESRPVWDRRHTMRLRDWPQ
jgi:hypothetical protein